MTNDERLELLARYSEAVRYAQEHCGDELASLTATRTAETALEASNGPTASKYPPGLI